MTVNQSGLPWRVVSWTAVGAIIVDQQDRRVAEIYNAAGEPPENVAELICELMNGRRKDHES